MFGHYTIRLTRHAREQIENRGVTTADEVLKAVNSVKRQVLSSSAWQVKVILKRVDYQYTGGSEGNLVVACVDPVNRTIKTVMLEGENQYYGRSKDGRTGEYIWS